MIKKFIYFCLPVLGLFSSVITFAQVDSTKYKIVVASIEEGKSKFAPDKRTKLIELTSADLKKNTYVIQTTESDALPFLQEKLQKSGAQVKVQLYPDTSVGMKTFGIVNLSVANLRTKPGHASEMASQAILGTQVDILQKSNGEYRVRTPEGYISWVPTSSLVPMTTAELQQWKNRKKIVYTNDFGKAYSKPDVKSIRISDLVYGNILALEKESSQFYEVAYPDGRIGYVPKDEALTLQDWITSRNLTPDNVLNSAKSMLGLPYLWGGTSVKGVDCSGFTKTAFFMNGYVIPRDASQQVLVGETVDILGQDGHFDAEKALKNLKPADLLFFAAGKASNPNARVTHVALYMGNGEFIHSAGTVRVNSMLKDASNYDDFQTRTVVAAKRYVGAKDNAIVAIQDNPFYKK
ncbi:C40 family peptidase [Sphingobacterium faecale]|uniref:C40 family peptidase n=1 Tax=Sphingobacterium faecale TaxID=2803775 RepID=A0ABS1R1B8_9SPHI|nr:NlpC/P60 family protein [Sphingobacterium faecale]MBL1408485.1 C40 family peptidase [Sphingobacterium faecale]